MVISRNNFKRLRELSRTSLTLTAVRDGKRVDVRSEDLVPGDVVILQENIRFGCLPVSARVIAAELARCLLVFFLVNLGLGFARLSAHIRDWQPPVRLRAHHG
jgi:hypothetical protein